MFPFARIAATGAAASAVMILAAAPAWAALPQYTIIDLGVVTGTTSSQGIGVSPDGSQVVGRALGSTAPAFVWSAATGMVGLPNLAGRNFAVANDISAGGLIVGTSMTTAFGSGALPVAWQDGVLTALPLPAGQTVGRAEAVNAAGVAAGSVGGGIAQRGALFTLEGATTITAVTANGSWMTSAFGINDAGLAVGNGVDPNNAAVNVGLVYDSATGTMTSIGALPGANGALAFDISESGWVVGSSMLNQGSGMPFIWSAPTGMLAVPLPAGTSQGSLRGVNDAGWAVGTASSAYAVPFVYDGNTTVTIDSLVPAGSGWNFATTTSASAMAITNDGVIIGTATYGGQIHAYALMPVPEPATWATMGLGLLLTGAAARRAARRRAG